MVYVIGLPNKMFIIQADNSLSSKQIRTWTLAGLLSYCIRQIWFFFPFSSYLSGSSCSSYGIKLTSELFCIQVVHYLSISDIFFKTDLTPLTCCCLACHYRQMLGVKDASEPSCSLSISSITGTEAVSSFKFRWTWYLSNTCPEDVISTTTNDFFHPWDFTTLKVGLSNLPLPGEGFVLLRGCWSEIGIPRDVEGDCEEFTGGITDTAGSSFTTYVFEKSSTRKVPLSEGRMISASSSEWIYIPCAVLLV